MVFKIAISVLFVLEIMDFTAIMIVSKHADICAKGINQQQYELDVITQYIKGDK